MFAAGNTKNPLSKKFFSPCFKVIFVKLQHNKKYQSNKWIKYFPDKKKKTYNGLSVIDHLRIDTHLLCDYYNTFGTL